MKKIPKGALFAITFILAVAACFGLSKLLFINTIHVSGGSLIGLDEFSNTPLLLINESDLTKKLLLVNPTIEKILVDKQYPNTLSLRVERARAAGLLAVSKGYYVLSSGGKVISKERTITKKLPLITIGQKFPFESYTVGETMSNEGIVSSAYILGQFAQNNIPIDTVEIRGFDVVVCKGAGHTYVFSASKNKAEQFSDFLIVYRQFFVEGKRYSSIDVRFEKPVVVFEK